MNQATALLGTLAAIYLAACISPGPNWFMIGELAASHRHREAARVALGISAGSTAWATLSITGLATVLQGHPGWAFVWRLAGAAYLVWCGVAMLRRAGAAPSSPSAGRPSAATVHGRAFRIGLLTSLTNPKAGMFWTSVFAASVPGPIPVGLAAGLVLMVAAMSSLFHVGLARLLRSGPLQAGYYRYGPWIRRFSGLFLTIVGLRLILPA